MDSWTSALGQTKTDPQFHTKLGTEIIGNEGNSPLMILDKIPSASDLDNHHLHQIPNYQEPLFKSQSIDSSFKNDFKSSSIMMAKGPLNPLEQE